MAALLIPCLTEWDFLPPDSRANAAVPARLPRETRSLRAGAGTGQAQGEREAAGACRQCSTKKPLGNINRCFGQQTHLAAVLRGAAGTQPGGWAAEGLQESSPSRGQGW